MDVSKWAAAFNQWMDDFTNDPESFEAIETVAIRHLREQLDGRAPTYGERMAAILAEYLARSA
jgi:hypothetical protein